MTDDIIYLEDERTGETLEFRGPDAVEQAEQYADEDAPDA